jgi:hypothetical protein
MADGKQAEQDDRAQREQDQQVTTRPWADVHAGSWAVTMAGRSWAEVHAAAAAKAAAADNADAVGGGVSA